MRDIMTEDTEPLVRVDRPDPSGTRRAVWILGAIVVIAVAVVAWRVLSGTSASDGTTSGAALSLADVVRTDLQEVTTLDGTLGRAAGEAVTASFAGTITAVPSAGSTVESGQQLYEIDATPVILLRGETPAYRDLAVSDERTAIGSRLAGTLTSVLDEGSVVEQGDVLFEVDGRPVVALYGDVPAYRAMRDEATNQTGDDILQLETDLVALGYDPGNLEVDGEFTGYTEQMVEDWQDAVGAVDDGVVDLGEVVFIPGPTEVVSVDTAVGDAVGSGSPVLTVAGSDAMAGNDVRQLEEALTALGYDVGAVDGTFDAATKAGVLAWQGDAGLEADGIVDLGEVVFLSNDVRIASIDAVSGSPVNPGGAVLSVTSSDIVVTAELPAEDQDILEVGQAVQVELPDTTKVGGTVDQIDSVATRNASGQTVFEVTITLDDVAAAGDLDEAPVDVEVVTDSVSDVMAVPVTALLALREGGYAVEVADGDGSTRLVPVDTGFYADGMVEITSDGVSPGEQVVVP
jgi:peptidoglycan hydrolase-like protein with peptidoglycan-binding domain